MFHVMQDHSRELASNFVFELSEGSSLKGPLVRVLAGQMNQRKRTQTHGLIQHHYHHHLWVQRICCWVRMSPCWKSGLGWAVLEETGLVWAESWLLLVVEPRMMKWDTKFEV